MTADDSLFRVALADIAELRDDLADLRQELGHLAQELEALRRRYADHVRNHGA